jgi:hypothetical protein
MRVALLSMIFLLCVPASADTDKVGPPIRLDFEGTLPRPAPQQAQQPQKPSVAEAPKPYVARPPIRVDFEGSYTRAAATVYRPGPAIRVDFEGSHGRAR